MSEPLSEKEKERNKRKLDNIDDLLKVQAVEKKTKTPKKEIIEQEPEMNEEPEMPGSKSKDLQSPEVVKKHKEITLEDDLKMMRDFVAQDPHLVPNAERLIDPLKWGSLQKMSLDKARQSILVILCALVPEDRLKLLRNIAKWLLSVFEVLD